MEDGEEGKEGERVRRGRERWRDQRGGGGREKGQDDLQYMSPQSCPPGQRDYSGGCCRHGQNHCQ